MLVDFILLVLTAVCSVGLTVVGGVVSSDKKWARLSFFIGGPVLVLLSIAQGWRQISAQQASDDAFMASKAELQKERNRSDAKIDGLFALLKTQTKEQPSETAKDHRSAQTPTQKGILPAGNGTLSISQTDKPSTRADAPYHIEVVIQTIENFQSLKLALECDQPIVDAGAQIGGATGSVQFMTSFGILAEHPNVYVYSYGSSVPPFGPANPLIIEIWSKTRITCKNVATF
jgi:hypothetical protein